MRQFGRAQAKGYEGLWRAINTIFDTLDESEYFNTDWNHAARRVMSPTF